MGELREEQMHALRTGVPLDDRRAHLDSPSRTPAGRGATTGTTWS